MRKKLLAVLLASVLLMSCILPVGAADGSGPVRGTAAVSGLDIQVDLFLPAGSGAESGSLTFRYGALTLQSTARTAPETFLVDLNPDSAGTVTVAWTGTPAGDTPLVTFRLTAKGYGEYILPVEDVAVYGADYQPLSAEDFALRVHVACTRQDADCPSAAYSDVSRTAWYHDAVDYVIANGIMEGVGNGKFAPQATMTRGMLMKVLGTLEGIDPGKYVTRSFRDVSGGAWYAPYVEWAYEAGLAKGYGDGVFAPNRLVSREEMATFFYRYNQLKGGSKAAGDTAYKTFTDTDQVSGWAVEAMQWATAVGLINGVGDGRLAPKAMSVRAQAAKIIMVYLSL